MAPFDYEEIALRLRAITPGQRIVYFTGFLDSERLERPRGAAAEVATLAIELYRLGRVTLTQRRLGPPLFRSNVDWRNGHGPGFDYIAIGVERSSC